MSFTCKRNLINFDDNIKNEKLNRVTYVKDLCITLDSKLLFDQQITNIVNKASKGLGFVIRASKNFKKIKIIKFFPKIIFPWEFRDFFFPSRIIKGTCFM